MNAVEKTFIDILKAYVHDEKINVTLENKVTWEKILEESREHCVDGVVYSSIKWDDNTTYIDENLKNTWKNNVFSQSIWQINHIKKACALFNEFNKHEIEFVALKGFIIRNFYKRPEHRLMGDIDILIHKDDLDKITSCLYDLGYEKSGEAGHHAGFINSEEHQIEVHWNLVNRDYFRKEVLLEKELWKNIKRANINGAEVLVLSMEDMLVHLCLHMAVHIAAGGFGIRQLLDISLIIKEKNQEIDWRQFKAKTKKNNIERFSYIVFLMCNILFHIDIPKELQNSFNIREEELDIFIEDILKNGVHGKREGLASVKAQVAFDLNEEPGSNNLLKGYLRLLFPKNYEISDKYNYAKENKILLPIAWIHRLVNNGLFSRRYKLKEKVDFLTVNILKSYKRNKLMKWLNL